MKTLNLVIMISLLIIINGCASTSSVGPSYNQNETSKKIEKTENPLDVSIAVFNPGIPSNPDEYNNAEKEYYKKIYKENYDYECIPYYWMPKWVETNNPSARIIGFNHE